MQPINWLLLTSELAVYRQFQESAAKVMELGIIPQRTVFELAGITRSEFRGWHNLLAPVADKKAKHPTYSAAQALAICVLAELMHVLDCGVKHLVPISQDFFNEICSGDWRRFEHRRLVVQIDQELDVSNERKFALAFRTIPKTEAFPDTGTSTVVMLHLAPFVHRVDTRLSGVQSKPTDQQRHSLEERLQRRSKHGDTTERNKS